MSIDKNVKSCEVNSVGKPNFTGNYEIALKKVRADTGYNGKFDGPQRTNFFEEFDVVPRNVDGRPIGVKINYKIRREEPKEQPKPVKSKSVSGPTLESITYRL